MNVYKNFNELLFADRNKTYGAYVLRNMADVYMLKAFLIGVSIFATLFTGVFLYYNYNNHTQIIIDNIEHGTIVTLTEIADDEDYVVPPVEDDVVEQQTHYQEKTQQKQFIMPDAVKNPVVESVTVPKQVEMVGHDLGSENRTGDPSEAQTGGGPENTDINAPRFSQTTSNTQAVPTNNAGTGDNQNTANTGKALSAKTVTVMAVYPGCEKEATKGKDHAIKCFSDKIKSDLSYELLFFEDIAHREGISKAVAKLDFVIDRQGNIIKVKPMKGSEQILGKEASSALERINSSLQKKGKKITPAKNEDGNPVNLTFQIPVTYTTH